MLSKYVVALLPFLALPAMAGQDETNRLDASAKVLDEIMAAGDKSIPADLLHKAHCVVVIPGMRKAGFVFSAKYGRGFATCRRPGGWSAPGAMRIEGGGFGLQIGGAETDILMLVMSENGMKGILASKVTLGGEASAAAGPVGRDTTAQTDATMRADILSWSRSRGVFGGVSLQSGTLRADSDVNKSLYKQELSNKEILSGKVPPPSEAKVLIDAVTKYGGTVEVK